MNSNDQPTCDSATKWRTHQAVGAARANSSAGTHNIEPSTSVNITRDSPGSDVFHDSSAAATHCTAKMSRNARCVPNVSCATTS
jgi:hypothetical protein